MASEEGQQTSTIEENRGYLRVHGNAANCMEDVCGLLRLNTDGDRHLEAKPSAVYVRLNFVSLQVHQEGGDLEVTSIRTCCARSKSDFVATNRVGI